MLGIRTNRGFTLIEVLVASLILFLVVTTMMTIYRGAMLSSNKSTETLNVLSSVSTIKTIISERIREQKQEDTINEEGTLGDVTYRWTSQKAAMGRASSIQVEGDGFERQGPRVYLWYVKLEISASDTVRDYEFWELVW